MGAGENKGEYKNYSKNGCYLYTSAFVRIMYVCAWQQNLKYVFKYELWDYSKIQKYEDLFYISYNIMQMIILAVNVCYQCYFFISKWYFDTIIAWVILSWRSLVVKQIMILHFAMVIDFLEYWAIDIVVVFRMLCCAIYFWRTYRIQNRKNLQTQNRKYCTCVISP